jgi:hypothetical protein
MKEEIQVKMVQVFLGGFIPFLSSFCGIKQAMQDFY